MEKDKRLKQLAANVLKNSVCLKKSEQIYIEAIGKSTQGLMEEFINESVKLGGVPFYYYNDNALTKELIRNADESQIKAHFEIHKRLMETSQAYIAIRGYDDLFELSELPDEKVAMYQEHYWHPLHSKIRVPKTKWCVMRYPNNTLAAVSKMPTKVFEDFYFNACLLDYKKMGKAMQPLKDLMDRTDRVKIVAPGTNLEFSIKKPRAVICDGKVNIPDGEVFTAPEKTSINGVVQFNTETAYLGNVFSNIRLEFKDGKIIDGHSAVNDESFQKILNMDEGSRYMGEFALGVNPYITKPILDILFDEKISGSFHMAIGNSYDDESNNGNKSAIHWDLVQIQTPEYGGGEIYFDNVLIRKDGRFVLKELEELNPENLR